MRASSAMFAALISLSAPLFAADENFFQDAARGGMAEVALGQLAATRASSASVKAFGTQMVREHGAANVKLQAAAARSGVQLPGNLAEDVQATQNKLASLSGSAFDLEYVDSQIKAHAKTIALLEHEIANGSDPAAKAWASEALPTVKRHAEMISSLDAIPGEHDREHALGTPGPADAAPASAPPR